MDQKYIYNPENLAYTFGICLISQTTQTYRSFVPFALSLTHPGKRVPLIIPLAYLGYVTIGRPLALATEHSQWQIPLHPNDSNLNNPLFLRLSILSLFLFFLGISGLSRIDIGTRLSRVSLSGKLDIYLLSSYRALLQNNIPPYSGSCP